MIKLCKSCGSQKHISLFNKARQSTGQRTPRGGLGVSARCKECVAEARKPGIAAERNQAGVLAASGLKRCSCCKEEKSRADYHVRRASKDGLAYKCTACVNLHSERWRQSNPGAFQGWYQDNKGSRAEYWADWYVANKVALAKSYARYARDNKHVINALIAKRRAAKRAATPPWADLNAIRNIYEEASRLTAETGIRHEVDHIYPLQGENVCGLHCEANLQILTKSDNARKKNKMPDVACS